MSIRGIGGSNLTVIFVVTDAASGKAVPDAHIALYTELGEVYRILRTDENGVAHVTTECTVATGVDENPLTGFRWRTYKSVRVPEWLVLSTAKGYQPSDPWSISDRYRAAAVAQGDSFRLAVVITLNPQMGEP